jgi:hypothetical protein
MPQVEVFTPTGVVNGSTTRTTIGSDETGAPTALRVDASRWYPLDGGPPQQRGALLLAPDEMLIVVLAPPPFTLHASWSPIELDAGPYHIEASLPVAPGFDPARALARPSGVFVALRDVAISLPGRPDGGVAQRPHAHVNRYAVERVSSSLMLAFFFPGATFATPEDPLGGLPVPLASRRVQLA